MGKMVGEDDDVELENRMTDYELGKMVEVVLTDSRVRKSKRGVILQIKEDADGCITKWRAETTTDRSGMPFPQLDANCKVTEVSKPNQDLYEIKVFNDKKSQTLHITINGGNAKVVKSVLKKIHRTIEAKKERAERRAEEQHQRARALPLPAYGQSLSSLQMRPANTLSGGRNGTKQMEAARKSNFSTNSQSKSALRTSIQLSPDRETDFVSKMIPPPYSAGHAEVKTRRNSMDSPPFVPDLSKTKARTASPVNQKENISPTNNTTQTPSQSNFSSRLFAPAFSGTAFKRVFTGLDPPLRLLPDKTNDRVSRERDLFEKSGFVPERSEAASMSSYRPLLPPHLGAGIRNEGNTCYMGSSLQLIGAFEPFRGSLNHPWLAKFQEVFPIEDPPRLTKAVVDLFQQNSEQGSWCVQKLVHACACIKVLERFKPGPQQDAQEFLGLLLDNISEEVKRIQKELKEVLEEDEIPNDPVERNFEFKVREETICAECGNKSPSSTPDRILCLGHGRHEGQSARRDNNLRNLLHHHFEPTALDQWACDRCGMKNAQQSRVFVKIPRGIILQVKRYDNNTRRVNMPIPAPLFLDLGAYCATDVEGPYPWHRPAPPATNGSDNKRRLSASSPEPADRKRRLTEDAVKKEEQDPVFDVEAKMDAGGALPPLDQEDEDMRRAMQESLASATEMSQGLPTQNSEDDLQKALKASMAVQVTEDEELQRALEASMQETQHEPSYVENQYDDEDGGDNMPQPMMISGPSLDGQLGALGTHTGPRHTYYLCAVVLHIGESLAGGHYTTLRRDPLTGKWYEYDDKRVSEVSNNYATDRISRNGYMFLYSHSTCTSQTIIDL